MGVSDLKPGVISWQYTDLELTLAMQKTMVASITPDHFFPWDLFKKVARDGKRETCPE